MENDNSDDELHGMPPSIVEASKATSTALFREKSRER